MARIPPKLFASVPCFCMATSSRAAPIALEVGLITPMWPMKKLHPRVTQPVRSGSRPWFRPCHLWPGPWSYGSGPMVHSQPQYQSKASKHLLTCLPDSRAFSGSMLSWGKNLTHHHGPCGPTELCGLISLHSHTFPPIPTLHQCLLHGVGQRNVIQNGTLFHQLNSSVTAGFLSLRTTGVLEPEHSLLWGLSCTLCDVK